MKKESCYSEERNTYKLVKFDDENEWAVHMPLFDPLVGNKVRRLATCLPGLW